MNTPALHSFFVNARLEYVKANQMRTMREWIDSLAHAERRDLV